MGINVLPVGSRVSVSVYNGYESPEEVSMTVHKHLAATQPKELPRVKTILLVEDDDDIGEFLVATLVQKSCYRVLRASTSFAALHVLTYLEPDLLILEYHLPDMDGIQLSDRLHLLHGREAIPTILLGAALPVMEIKKRKIVGVHNPFDLGNFLLTIERVLTHSSPRHYSISGG